ncbi:MAG: hypothetical protein ACOX3U_05925 [Christensenellales bacterium]|jgi:hypothetical protein
MDKKKDQDILEFVKEYEAKNASDKPLSSGDTQAVVSSREDKDYIDNINSEGLFNETKAEEKPAATQIKEEKKLSDFISIGEVGGGINEIEEKILKETPKVPEEPELSAKELKKQEKERRKIELRERKEREEAERRKWTTYHHGFVLADGEKIVKEYNCLKLINPPGSGFITLTNKRLLCSTNELAETEINNITGIISRYKAKFSFAKLILFILLGGLASASIMASMNYLINLDSLWPTHPGWFKYVLYSVAGIAGLFALMFIFTVRRKEFRISIFTKSDTPIISYSGTTGRVKPTVIRVHPGKESKVIVHEIGALILEIKAGKY